MAQFSPCDYLALGRSREEETVSFLLLINKSNSAWGCRYTAHTVLDWYTLLAADVVQRSARLCENERIHITLDLYRPFLLLLIYLLLKHRHRLLVTLRMTRPFV